MRNVAALEAVPAGAYAARIVDYEFRDSQAGNEYINWVLEIVSDEAALAGRKLYVNTTLTPESLWRLKQFIEAALGKEIPSEEFDFDPAELVGKTVLCTVKNREYEGRMQADVRNISALSPNGAKLASAPNAGSKRRRRPA